MKTRPPTKSIGLRVFSRPPKKSAEQECARNIRLCQRRLADPHNREDVAMLAEMELREQRRRLIELKWSRLQTI